MFFIVFGRWKSVATVGTFCEVVVTLVRNSEKFGPMQLEYGQKMV